MRKILISHIDLDGLGAVILSLVYDLNFDEIRCWQNGYENIDVLKKFDEIIVVDFSLSEETIKLLKNLKKKILIFDHHESATYIKKFDENILDIKRCGTKIFYQNYINSFKNLSISRFVEIIDTFDLWKNDNEDKFEEALNFQRIFKNLTLGKIFNDNIVVRDGKILNSSFQKFIARYTGKLFNDDFKFFDSYEKRIIFSEKDLEEKILDETLKTLKTRTDERNNIFGIIVFKKGNVSIIANEIMKRFKNLVYIIILYPFNPSKFSIRSKKEFNILDLKNVQGHKNSGGGILKINLIENFYNKDDKTFDYKN